MRKEELRHLDAAIALLVGKCEQVHVDPTTDKYWMWTPDVVSDEVPCYSTDGNAMLELDKEMRKRGWCLQLVYWETDGEFCATYGRVENEQVVEYDVFSKDEPLARALAAYKALTGKEWGSGNNE